MRALLVTWCAVSDVLSDVRCVFQASDPEQDVLRYSVTSGNDDEHFAIDASR